MSKFFAKSALAALFVTAALAGAADAANVGGRGGGGGGRTGSSGPSGPSGPVGGDSPIDFLMSRHNCVGTPRCTPTPKPPRVVRETLKLAAGGCARWGWRLPRVTLPSGRIVVDHDAEPRRVCLDQQIR